MNFRCRKWVQNTRRADLLDQSADYLYNNCVLCAEHFEDGQFMNKVAYLGGIAIGIGPGLDSIARM